MCCTAVFNILVFLHCLASYDVDIAIESGNVQ